jgi:hypothetical protein
MDRPPNEKVFLTQDTSLPQRQKESIWGMTGSECDVCIPSGGDSLLYLADRILCDDAACGGSVSSQVTCCLRCIGHAFLSRARDSGSDL